ncbi:hypothetical protein CBS101457_004453 [Exobasidium rhododendri]|nr:hypothetical protein CBS101457_004453 [Exobasidium rhododendri]
MSFLLPSRSIGRHGLGGRTSFAGLNFQSGTRQLTRQAVRQPSAIASTFRSSDASSSSSKGTQWFGSLALIAGLGLSTFNSSKSIHMEGLSTSAPFSSTTSDSRVPSPADMPKSDVNVYNLGFGTVCGICSGVFIKKGAKFIAFLLGGGFVLLQYLNTQRIITVNWRSLSSRYDSAISKVAGEDAINVNKPVSGWGNSTAARIWNRTFDFLTADFPSRGTFVAGLLLGLRLG